MSSIYENMDGLNLDALKEAAGSENWPKGKRWKSNLYGTEFTVQTYLSKAEDKWPGYGHDAYTAINSMKVRELSQDEIHWETDGEPQYTSPEFDTKLLKDLTKDELAKRKEFMIAVANLINSQEAIDAIAAAADKKKNGTFHKGRVVKIALSGISDSHDRIYAIVGRAKNDTSMSITFEDVMCHPGDNDLWANDIFNQLYGDKVK